LKKKRLPTTRFPLLVHRRLFRMWFWPSMLLLVAAVLLLVFDPLLLGTWRWALLPLTLVSGLLTVYAVMARAAYVQAHPKALRLRTPLLPLVISYGRLNTVRTTPFKAQYPPERLSWSQRQLAEKLYGRTCLMVELTGYPISRRLLSLILGRFLLPIDSTGLVLLVEDWLQLSNEIEGARAEWVLKRTPRRPDRTVERVLNK
jgi:hypothetical protein